MAEPGEVVEEPGAHGAASDDHALRLVAHGVPLFCSRVVGLSQLVERSGDW